MNNPPQGTNIIFKRPILFSFFFTFFLFLLGVVFFTPFFQTNDDMVMNWITRGVGLVDRPSEFLLTMNVALGMALKCLNSAFPQVPWYGPGFYLLFFLSVWALLAAFFSKNRSAWACFLLTAVGIPVFFQCYAWPQYTIFCFLAMQAGVFLLVDPIRPRYLSSVGAVFLMTAASLVRLEAALFSMGASAVYIAQMLWAERGQGTFHGKLRILATAGFLILSGASFNHFIVSAHPEWREAREYYEKRFSIGEVKVTNYKNQEPAFRSVGWSPEDYQAFSDGFYENPAFNLENLGKLDGLLKPDFSLKRELLMVVLHNPLILFLLFVFWAGAAMALWLKAPVWKPVFWTVFSVGLLILSEKIVTRVIWPQIFFAILLMAFLLPPPRLPSEDKPKGRWIFAVLAVLLVLFSARTIWENYASNRPGPAVRAEIMESMKALSPRQDQLFIVWGSSFPFVGFPIFHVDDSLKDFRLLYMWWFEKSPYGEERLTQFHIHDFLRDTVDRPDVFWLINDPTHSFEEYIREKTGMKVSRKLVFHGYFDVFRMVSEKNGSGIPQ